MLLTTECERLWRNVRIATLDPAVAKPYGMLENQNLGIRAGLVSLILPEGECDLSGFAGEVIDAKGCLLTPGLIDSHTHLVYGGNRSGEFEQRLRGASYADIARAGGGIMSTVRATRALSEEELVELARPRLEALLREGCTTVEIKSGYGLTAGDELKMLRAARTLGEELPVRIRTTLLAAHAVPPEYKDNPDGYLDMICDELIPRVAEEGLADGVDIFCESIAFTLPQAERLFQAARRSGLGIKVHAEQLTAAGAAALAARYGAWSADHLEYLDEAGAFEMQASGTIALLLPGAFYFLQETRKPPIELLRRLGVPMALATDLNPGSSPLASLRLMMNMGCTLFGLTPEEALAAVTRNAALALGLGNCLGTLAVGKEADMLLWDLEHPSQIAAEVGWGGPVRRIFKGELCHVPESVTPPYLRWPERPQPWAFPRIATARRRFTRSNERNAPGGVVAPALSGAPVYRRHGFGMYKPPDMTLWQGRIDQEPEGDLRRWHQAVIPLSPDGGEPGIALLGICSDSGVLRNHGRPGARNGPDAIRAALGGQAWHLELQCYDAGNLICIDDDLEALQEEQACWVEKLLELGHFPLILGGGHEIAFGSYLGLSRRLERQGDAAVIGIINFDAHFDLRKSPQANSGTSFLQIADLCREQQRQFRYFCLGLSEVSNTKALFARARALGVEWLLDESLTSWNLAHAEQRLTEFLAGCDSIYLSIDLDVLPLAVAPGVSAPAARGVPLEVVEHLLTWIRNKAGKRLALADIAENNPAFDSDGRTAKVAARLCHLLAR